MLRGSMVSGRRNWSWASLAWIGLVGAVIAHPPAGLAVSCTTQAEMAAPKRDALAVTAQRLAQAVAQQDYTTLQGALLPSVSGQWDGIRGAAEDGSALMKGGQVLLRSLYMLDASTLTSPADTQFFCSNANGTLTVTISMRSLPAGKYAVVLADATGAQLGGQVAFILGLDANVWKLGGVFVRPGSLDGHDGVWYWQKGRDLEKSNAPWAAWLCYETARYLLVPVDFLSSPNLEKLGQEQGSIKGSPAEALPYSLTDGARTWKIEAVRLDTSLHQVDFGVTYQSTGVTDPAAARTEAVSVLSALLKTQPALRSTFHGVWAYASRDGKVSPVMELPMEQIP